MRNTGRFFLHTSDVRRLSKVLKEKDPPKGEELSFFLSCINYYCLGKDFIYDNTVNDEVTDALLEFRDTHSVYLVSKNAPHRKAHSNMIVNSVKDCEEEFVDISSNKASWQPFTKGNAAEVFFNVLGTMQSLKNPDRRFEIAQEAYKNQVYGGKLLLGLADESNIKILERLPENGSLRDKQVLMGSLVGMFRSIYLGRRADEFGAIYVGKPKSVKYIYMKGERLWKRIATKINTYRGIDLSLKDSSKNKILSNIPCLAPSFLIDAAEKKVRKEELFQYFNESDQSRKFKKFGKKVFDRCTMCKDMDEIEDEISQLIYEINPASKKSKNYWKTVNGLGMYGSLVAGIALDASFYSKLELPPGLITVLGNAGALGISKVIKLLEEHFDWMGSVSNQITQVERDPKMLGNMESALIKIWR